MMLATLAIAGLLAATGAVRDGHASTADNVPAVSKEAQGSDTLPVPPPPPPGDDFHPDGRGWTLAWSDEFAGSALDRSKWAPEVSCWGGGNKERQCYTDRPRNVQVINGVLRLKAYREAFTGPLLPPGAPGAPGGTRTQAYTSGKVRTLGIAEWQYGRFEARIKLPVGQGTWPAFWMMPSEAFYGAWAASGEIDIMETVNLGAACDTCSGDMGENRSVAALHFGGRPPENTHIKGRATLPAGTDAFDTYHVFAAEWGEGLIQWFVNDRKIFQATSDDWFTTAEAGKNRPAAPFDRPFYFLINLAVGGAFPERENETGFDPASFPNELLVDWVRVYQCAPDRETGRACMAAEKI